MPSLQSTVGKVLSGLLVVSSFATVTAGAGASTKPFSKTSVARAALSAHSNDSLNVSQFQDPNPQPGDDFGASVSVSKDGSTAVVGAQTYSNGSNALSGAAYVFINNGSGWSLATTLIPTDQGLYDRLGISTSINPNGNQIVVGADYIPYANVTPTKQGKAYVFSMPAGGWASNTITSESAELQGSDILPGDTFGWSVSQSSNGSEVLVTAEYKNVNGVGYAGEAYVFNEPVGGWNSVSSPITENQILLPSTVIANAIFGWAATISQDGTKAYISAMPQGEVFEFIQPTNGWGSTGQLLNENSIIQSPTSIPGTPDSGFGFSLALSADASELIVGSPSETMQGSTATSSGTVFLFKNTPTGWVNAAEFSASDAMYDGGFGYSLSLSQDGQSALVGAPQQTVTGLLDAGAAYLFGANPDGTWSQQSEIFEPTPVQNDDFGWSVSMLDSSNIFVGAPALTSAGVASNVVVDAAQRLSSHLSLSANASLHQHGTAYAFQSHTSTRMPQQPLSISNPSVIGAVGTPISLSTTGGSGVIAPTFAVTGAGCSISGARLSSTQVATCVVTATNPANGNYSAVQSAPVTFHFFSPQPLLKISNTKLSGTAGTPLALTASRGSGSGLLSFSVTGANCTLSGTSLNATGLAQCVVTATKAASGSYGPAVSAPVTFTFALATQATLKVSNSVKKGTVGTPLALTASGGSGSGLLSFSVTGSGCAINGQRLTATEAGNCSVKATKASSGIYAVAVSPAVVFTFTLKK